MTHICRRFGIFRRLRLLQTPKSGRAALKLASFEQIAALYDTLIFCSLTRETLGIANSGAFSALLYGKSECSELDF